MAKCFFINRLCCEIREGVAQSQKKRVFGGKFRVNDVKFGVKMIRSFLLLIVAFMANCIFAQKNTARIDSLNLKSEILYTTDVEKSIELSSKALYLSKSADYQHG